MTLTLESLDRKIMRVARRCGQRVHRPVESRRPVEDETLGQLLVGAGTRTLVRHVRADLAGPIRAAVATRRTYLQARRVGKATRNSVRRAGKGVALLARAPQLLVAGLVAVLVVALVYYAWVAARKVEWLTGKIVPSSSTACTTTRPAGWLWFGGSDDGRGTSFVDFTAAMGGAAARTLHNVTAEREARALHWIVTTGTSAVVTLQHTLNGGSYVPAPAPNAVPGVPPSGVPAPHAPDLPPNVYTPVPSSSSGCTPCPSGSGTPAAYTPVAGPGVAGLTAEQAGNARTIIAVGQGMGVPSQGWVVALATALQESGLRNLPYGDRDSLGLFQQRPSAGWGTPAQVTTPTYAATAFYRHLLAVPGWQAMPVTVAAQTVQRSAFPNAYARWERTARDAVAQLAGVVTPVQPVNTSTPACTPSSSTA